VAWTVDELLAAMKRKSNLPTGTNAKFTDTEILSMAHSVLITQVDPILTNLREEYGVTREDFALTAGDGTVVLPERAISGTIRQVLLVRPDGTSYPLERVAEADTWQFERPGQSGLTPVAYALEDDVLRLLPAPADATYSVRIKYRRRPSRFVLSATCHQLTFLPVGLVVTTSGPATTSGDKDLVRARPPFGVPVQGVNATAAGSGTVTFTFDAAATAGLADARVGDWICVKDTTCVLPVPERFQELLLDLATAELLLEWGDRASAQDIRETVSTYVDSLAAAQSNRAEAQPQIVFQGASALRGGFGRGWYR
jgi:hypothetical protein